jgi:hypothetical protein
VQQSAPLRAWLWPVPQNCTTSTSTGMIIGNLQVMATVAMAITTINIERRLADSRQCVESARILTVDFILHFLN